MCKLKILNSSRFIKVNNIYCVGKNYYSHIKEFGSTKIPDEPIIFIKPNSSIVHSGGTVSIPEINAVKISNDLHHEVELVIIIGENGVNIPENQANDYILGYAVGLDMTLRDVQTSAKKNGIPWAVSKGFKTSAPVSDIILKKFIKNPMNLDISLSVNDINKQFTNTSLMIYNINKLIAYISSIFSLQKGDLIFTGTPSGVSGLQKNDMVTAKLGDLVKLEISID